MGNAWASPPGKLRQDDSDKVMSEIGIYRQRTIDSAAGTL
jgi:hypothetical protein